MKQITVDQVFEAVMSAIFTTEITENTNQVDRL
jgi:hypothetical protein